MTGDFIPTPTSITCPFCGKLMSRYSLRYRYGRTRAWYKDSHGHRVLAEMVDPD